VPALTALGVLLGVAAGLIFRVFRGADGVPRSQAGPGYATLWTVIAAARIAFSYATSHSHGLQAWLQRQGHSIPLLLIWPGSLQCCQMIRSGMAQALHPH
jgi:hypothetical protein